MADERSEENQKKKKKDAKSIKTKRLDSFAYHSALDPI